MQIMRWNGTRFTEPASQTFQVNSLAISKLDGTLYAVKNGTADLYKWNATNKSFDKINNLTVDTFGVDGDGRPWLCNDTTPVLKRARD